MNTDFLADLQQRGLVHQTSAPTLADLLRSQRVTAYIGFDPTADSLHVGSLLPLVTLRRFQRAGHRPIGLVGGGTGLIGDPSGKESERTLLTLEKAAENREGIRRQIGQFLDFSGDAVLVDNAEWLCELNLVEFLRDVGKHFSVNQMIARDSVRMRLETREQGLSYTEFTYMLLQAYDFLALYDRYGCQLQMGGSDQWGNIVSGNDLVRRLRGAETYGLTMPLITRSDGKKFGKSEEGNVWLDAQRTSPYQFYQFWMNTEDADVVRYLKFFTDLPVAEIDEAARAAAAAPERRDTQRLLAEELTRLVHGPDALTRAQRATEVLFAKDADYRQLSAQELAEAFHGAPTTTLEAGKLSTPDGALVALLAETELYPSRGRARKDVPAGGVSVNNVPIRDAEYILSEADVLPGGFVILRKGKRTYHVLRVATN
ncbi:MAG: tyrosine--tRNA ligase [Phycisphaerae bacterium]|jgi:tyrosyl-tRNA synthetase